jgi:hypothetical protein
MQELLNNDSVLLAKAREAMQTGDLPRRYPDELWGGPATGARCAVCGATTTPGDIEVEFEFTRDSQRTKYHAHPRCFSIFSYELSRVPAAKTAGDRPE